MTMRIEDWLVMIVPILVVGWIGLKTRKYTRSVADFMAASRVAGRYLVATAQGEASYGATNVVAQFELFFVAGFTYGWWLQFNNIVWLFILLSGFIIYRYRESRVMTLAQFFELRYSKRFRVFTGILAFLSGILSYGIYPAVGARFFIAFCGLPDHFALFGHSIPTLLPLMVILIAPGILLTTMGGQLTLMVVDCLEGIISLVFYLCIAATLIYLYHWSDISSALTAVPEHQSLVNPFDSGRNADFGFWYVMIAIFVNAYGWQSSQIGHGFRSAAINAHEQKMGAILGPWRNEVRTLMLTVLCICAITFMHSAHGQQILNQALAGVKGTALESQLKTPAALGHMLPPVIRGMFASIMLFALISTDCTMMHSWGTIFVQDIVVPLRKKPLATRAHVNLLRWAVVGVALFALAFSFCFNQTTYINMFLAIVGAVFFGAGACIIGGFYTRRGTTAAAWGAMISAAAVSLIGGTLTQTWKPWLYPWLRDYAPGVLDKTDRALVAISNVIPNLHWSIRPEAFFLNGQWISCFAAMAAITAYVVLTMLTYRQDFDLDKLLHRGKYAVGDPDKGKAAGEYEAASTTSPVRQRFSPAKLIGITPEFTRADKAISLSLFGYRIFWFVIFAVVTVWNIIPSARWPESWWLTFWHYSFIWLPFGIASVMVVWFTWGGLRDIRILFERLKTVKRDAADDGSADRGH